MALSFNSVITFGKYKGLKLKELPLDYVEWIVKNTDTGNPFMKFIHNNEQNYREGNFGNDYDEVSSEERIDPETDDSLIECKRCSVPFSELPYSLTFATQHIKATCTHCGKYIKFIPKEKIKDWNESSELVYKKIDGDLDLAEALSKLVQHKYGTSTFAKGVQRDMACHNMLVEAIRYIDMGIEDEVNSLSL